MSGFLKFISPLAHPLGLCWLLLIALAVGHARRRQGGRAALFGLAAALLWLISQPPIVDPLLGRLERPWWEHTLEHAPEADAVIVLGGGWRLSPPEHWHLDLTEAGDRLITGAELCRRGRARVLVLGGDSVPPGRGAAPESELVARWVTDWSLGHPEVVSLGPVFSTREEAVGARALVESRRWKRLLLVTSAFHMRRAVATFEKAGVTVIPVACDFRFDRFGAAHRPWNAFPSDEAVNQLQLWWHEQVGWYAYRAFGKL